MLGPLTGLVATLINVFILILIVRAIFSWFPGMLYSEAGRIIVMACGGITARNIESIMKATGVTEVHLAARCTIESRMTFRNEQCFMGGALHPPEFRWHLR